MPLQRRPLRDAETSFFGTLRKGRDSWERPRDAPVWRPEVVPVFRQDRGDEWCRERLSFAAFAAFAARRPCAALLRDLRDLRGSIDLTSPTYPGIP
jgi:hypothetical protein